MIQTIGYNGKILNVKPNAGAVQGHYSITFKSLATVQQCICNSVCLSFQFHMASPVSVISWTQFLSLSSLAFYGTLQPPLSFANSCNTRVASRCNNKDRATSKQSNYMEFFQLVFEENNTIP